MIYFYYIIKFYNIETFFFSNFTAMYYNIFKYIILTAQNI